MTDEEEFFAWLDGELDPETAARVAARVDADPALQALADEHRAMTRDLRAAFDPVMTAAPETAAMEPAAPLPANDNRPWWRAAAAAAAVALAFVGGTQFAGSPGLIDHRGGQMVATASLHEALDRQLASAPEGDIRIGVSFAQADGSFCRSFSVAGDSGLACRDGDAWRVEGLFSGEDVGGDFRMASGTDPRLAALIDARIAGEPLDAAAETAAREAGWR